MDVILRSVLGFLLQIGPSVILCVLPFGKSDFRFTQRWVYIDCILICLLTSFCFPFTLVLITNVSLENTNLIFNIYMLAVLLLFAALYFWIVRTEFVKKLLVLLLVVFYAATQYLIVNLTVSVFYDERVPEPYPTITLALYAVTTAVLFPAYAVIMRKGVKDYLAEVELKKHSPRICFRIVDYVNVFFNAYTVQFRSRFKFDGILVVDYSGISFDSGYFVHILLGFVS